ncbi:hypothetical protein PC116_g962 [Phytophthora cactorum]|uniref:Uncharacterized protein n=1 Tax=Phytophthora cactorum TaxID=29920 RepID=A0A8T1EUY9_9STRA|nr:hypothetical protein Pcac1_g21931 [Phytophthora cactorum]KAG2934735.1 hypothetical protein PC114_g927 [Phytophthora cactorum]KAG2955825.1 hypothetical protein PC117_g195 [Phytophthora cactorum]KAG3036142.1 hypothetical protein PC120_g451 [Phytophthora cactorum]KAG3042023.1 hypothetical protein PC119_g419 [Phytophthora cactorum]
MRDTEDVKMQGDWEQEASASVQGVRNRAMLMLAVSLV